MTNLRVFTEKGLDFIHQNMPEFFEQFKINKNNTSWIKEFCKKDPTTSSPYNFEFSFETNSLEPNKGEFDNAVSLYELFKTNKIGNAIIYNEKFASGFLLTYGYEYFFWASDMARESRVSATFFFDHRKGLRQAIARNLLTRLYKIVEMTVDESLEDKYELTRFVFENPALRRIVYYPNMDGRNSSKSFLKAILRIKKEQNDLQITTKVFEKARLQFSAFANANMIECMEENEAIERIYQSLKGVL